MPRPSASTSNEATGVSDSRNRSTAEPLLVQESIEDSMKKLVETFPSIKENHKLLFCDILLRAATEAKKLLKSDNSYPIDRVPPEQDLNVHGMTVWIVGTYDKCQDGTELSVTPYSKSVVAGARELLTRASNDSEAKGFKSSGEITVMNTTDPVINGVANISEKSLTLGKIKIEDVKTGDLVLVGASINVPNAANADPQVTEPETASFQLTRLIRLASK